MRDSILKRSVVLVVDDHPDTLRLLMDALDEAGATVLVATDGRQALEQVGRLMPDLILLDAVMPGMDGFEACRALKAGPAAEVPVIFMTGLEDTEHIVKGLEAGGIDYLTKPIAPDELLARMRIHLARAREAQGVRTALDVVGRTMLSCDARGRVRWATPHAQRVLARLAGVPEGTGEGAVEGRIELPAEVGAWLARKLAVGGAVGESVVADAPGMKIRFRLLSRLAEDEVLLVIQQAAPDEIERAGMSRLLERFGLTQREAEVLYWLACGKTNRDIAQILGISDRTADKHLEHVYGKIGVESRSGAIASALRVLGE